MNTRILLPVLGALAILAMAPTGSAATPYNICTPANAVCVVQTTSPFVNPTCSGWNYGNNVNQDAVIVNAAGTTASAQGINGCAHWFYNDETYSGVFITVTRGTTTAAANWYNYDVDYHWPGAPTDRHGTLIDVYATNAGATTGLFWQRTVITQAPTSDTCDTRLVVQNSPTSLGCPAGNPPSPPAENWGSVLP